MKQFEKDLYAGEIYSRDRFQFELKSEFTPSKESATTSYIQEFYLFIPNALQINGETYSAEQFYHDQTHLIRLKTPVFSLAELIAICEKSPLSLDMLDENFYFLKEEKCRNTLKLLGNIYRSALRRETRAILALLSPPQEKLERIESETELLLKKISKFLQLFSLVSKQLAKTNDEEYSHHARYVKSFMNTVTDYYLSGLLYELRKNYGKNHLRVDSKICQTIVKLGAYVKKPSQKNEDPSDHEQRYQEGFLYRRGILNKYILDPLKLQVNREAVVRSYAQYVGASAAALAMFVYLLLFIWQGNLFVLNSAPFVVFTVLIYVLKDRLKEGIKNIFAKRARRWFPDYRIDILTPGQHHLGTLNESFALFSEVNVDPAVTRIRNRSFHNVLANFQRSETVLYSRKEIRLKKPDRKEKESPKINTIFRFNIRRFLDKASDVDTPYLTLDPETSELIQLPLPKVYHLNMIIKNIYEKAEGSETIEIKKLRLIINKNGIQRVEKII